MDLSEINPADCQKCSEDAYPCSVHAQDWRYWKDRAHDAEEQAAANAGERDRLSKALQSERARNVAMEEASTTGADILSDLGDLLDARVGWFEGEGSVEHVQRALDERDGLRAELEEARLTLAAEQGRQEGAPDPAWSWSSGGWSRSYPNGDYSSVRRMDSGRAEWDRAHDPSTEEEIERPVCAVGRAPNFRAAMIASDGFVFP